MEAPPIMKTRLKDSFSDSEFDVNDSIFLQLSLRECTRIALSVPVPLNISI